MQPSPNFGDWLKQRRRALDLTQHDLAEAVGYSTWTIVKIEAGERRPSKQIVERLADCLRVPSAERETFRAFARGEARPAPGDLVPLAPVSALPDLPPALSNIPAAPNAFVGREPERATARALLERPGVRLLTLTGPAGVGKTRLALEIATDLLPSFPGGVTLVTLTPIRDPSLVLATIAAMLGIREPPGQPLLATVAAALGRHPRLLVLDNFEQVVAAAGLVADLLGATPGLKIVVTSRIRLHLYGEHELAVLPLPLPDRRAALTPAHVRAYAGVALFVERSLAARPGFALTPENAPAVVQICRRLDGLPLAIELAAARIKLLSPQAIVQRFEQQARTLPLLTGGPTNLPARQRTLRAAIAWSYALLDPPRQQVFRRLAVFVRGWTAESAQAVVGDDSPATGLVLAQDPLSPDAASDLLAAMTDDLATLVEQSLVYQEVSGSGGPRYTMLETLREFGLECLAAAGEEAAIRGRHAATYLALAEAAAQAGRGPTQAAWLDRLEQEHDNLRAALHWLIATGEGAQSGRLAAALGPFWLARGYISEGRGWLAQALALPVPPPVQAPALYAAGTLAVRGGDCAAAQTLLARSLALYTDAGDRPGQAQTLDSLGTAATRQSDYAAARAFYEASLAHYRALADHAGQARLLASLGEVARCQGHYDPAAALYGESLALYRQLADPAGIARALVDQGNIAVVQGRYPAAQALYEESLALFAALGDKWGQARVVNNLGEIARHHGDLAAAQARYAQSVALFREADGPAGVAGALANLAYVLLRAGDAPAAQRLYAESLGILRAVGDRNLTGVCLTGLAGVAAAQARPPRAARLLGAAAALLDSLGIHDPAGAADRADYDHLLAAVRGHLDPAAFAACWQEGGDLPWAGAIGYALGEITLP